MSTLEEIGALIRARPAVDDPELVAEWYEHKATMLHHIAGESASQSLSERDLYDALAEQAHAHAQRLWAEMGVGL
jgi:hypothetical protein